MPPDLHIREPVTTVTSGKDTRAKQSSRSKSGNQSDLMHPRLYVSTPLGRTAFRKDEEVLVSRGTCNEGSHGNNCREFRPFDVCAPEVYRLHQIYSLADSNC